MFFLAPAISFTLARNGMVSGGTSVTIGGCNFGRSNLSPTVRVMVSACGTSSWISNSGITCGLYVGGGVGTLQSVRITSESLVGSLSDAFTYDCSAKYASIIF